MRKLLVESVSLVGQTETITVTDFRKSPGDVLMQAQMGKTFNITKNGVVVAVLSAPPKCEASDGQQAKAQ